jgi:hypothetical protein
MKTSRMPALICIISAGVALSYAAYSAYLGITLTRSIPFRGQWVFVYGHLFPYLDGKYTLERLFSQSNEHRLLTTQLVLFVDAIWFQMRGYFPLVVMYAAMAAVAYMLAWLAVEPTKRDKLFTAFLMLLGIAWSISQYRDLGWAFEVGFPLLNAFTLGCLVCFGLALASQGGRQLAWMAAALFFDFLAIWSAGSGPAISVPLVLLCLWMRAWNRASALFFTGHVLIIWHYLSDYHFRDRRAWPSLERFVDVFTEFLGWNIQGPISSQVAGTVCLVAALGILAYATYRAIVRRSDRSLATIAAFTAFVLAEAVLVAYSRHHLGGASARHSSLTIAAPLVVTAGLWRAFFLSSMPMLRWVALPIAMALIVVTNRYEFEMRWRGHANQLDKITAAAKRSLPLPGHMQQFLTRKPKWGPAAIKRLRDERLGPFAD